MEKKGQTMAQGHSVSACKEPVALFVGCNAEDRWVLDSPLEASACPVHAPHTQPQHRLEESMIMFRAALSLMNTPLLFES